MRCNDGSDFLDNFAHVACSFSNRATGVAPGWFSDPVPGAGFHPVVINPAGLVDVELVWRQTHTEKVNRVSNFTQVFHRKSGS